MKKLVFKGIFFLAVLIASLAILETTMNRGNTDMTTDMASAEFPLVYMYVDGVKTNCMHGYSQEMTAAYMRDTITPIGTDRQISLEVDKYGAEIQKVSYEIRAADGSRLIEDGTLDNYDETDDSITTSFVIQDLIEEGNEYNLILSVQLSSGQTVYYYTRILEEEDYHVSEKLDFVQMFHEETFDKDKAADDLVVYLEPDETGDNTTYQTVNIHSSLDQITWGDLDVTQLGDADIDIEEMMDETASLKVTFLVSSGSGSDTTYYNVTEYFRIRYTDERIYLLDYTRYMNQIFDETASVYGTDTIWLGIQNASDVQISECDGGDIFAFVVGNKLYSYNAADDELALLFSFYDDQNMDDRTLYMEHSIKILNVDETGNVQFAVYGYMNRGQHEGGVGVQINTYNSTENTIEEQVYIPYTGSPDMLEKSLDNLLYTDSSDNLYLMMDTEVYKVDLTTHETETIVSNLQENSYKVSESNKMLVWSTNGDTDSSTELTVMNLSTGEQSTIEAPDGDYIKPLGFIEDDLIYGIAKQSDIITDSYGNVSFPMYEIKIQDEDGDVLKDYQVDGVYVTDCEVKNNQITLNRVVWDDATSSYVETDDDQIMDSEEEETSKNSIITASTEDYETITEISVKSSITSDNIKILTPKEVLIEGDNNANLESTSDSVDRFFVYDLYGLDNIYTDVSTAVQEAYDDSGVVINDYGNYVWYKGNLATKNQIMKITGEQETEEKSSLAVCLDTILDFEGVSRSSQYMLDSGQNAYDILKENIDNIQVLDLTGCSLDAMLFYLNQDIPVLVSLKDGSAELLTGFNDTEVVVMDTTTGTVYKITKTEAEEQFSESGNSFLTYIRTDD